jgi:hypothetical protein
MGVDDADIGIYVGVLAGVHDDVTVDGKKILKNVPVMFDTGSAYIFGDWDRVAELYKAIGGTLEERENLGYYYCEFGIAFGTLFLLTASSPL